MIKKVKPSEVQLGMYIHGFEGGWLNHPFWRTKFLLTEQDDLEALRACDVAAVLVDVSQSVARPTLAAASSPTPELVGANAPTMPEPRPAKSDPAPPRSYRPARPPQRVATFGRRTAPVFKGAPAACTPTEELTRANEVIGYARHEISRLQDDVRLGRSVEGGEVVPVVESIAASVSRNNAALISAARLKQKNDYTCAHSVAVCALMVNFARQLGFSEEQVHDAGVAGLLHDVGMVLVPEELIARPGPLNDNEMKVVRSHVDLGRRALESSSAVPEAALDMCLHHHERMDGSGYFGLSGDDIGLVARMGAICDVYDAVSSDRPHRPSLSAADAIARMFRWEGLFDTALLNSFIRSVGIYPVGTLVSLSSGSVGLVVEQNDKELTRPLVRIFYDADGAATMPFNVDLAVERGESIVGRANPPQDSRAAMSVAGNWGPFLSKAR